ncbi:MAG: hypothetical protein HYX48_03235 [Chlamydiales bacterium]|nr:hypothetical protein [Chlamydiales bacterium]
MTSLKPVSSIIADFCGDNTDFNAAAMSCELMTQCVIDEHRKPLLEIEGNPLPIHLQQLVVSFLYSEQEKSKIMRRVIKLEIAPPFIEDLCRRTGLSFSRHMREIPCFSLAESSSLSLSKNSVGFFRAAKSNTVSISHEFALSRWQNRDMLTLDDLPEHSDGDLAKLLAPCSQVCRLYVSNAPRLFTLEFVPNFQQLTKLSLTLPQLRNKQPIHLIPSEEIDLTPVDPTIPLFDLSKIQLPLLTALDVEYGPQLFQIDARHFPKLNTVGVVLYGIIEDGTECPTGRKVLLLGNQQCTVDCAPSYIRIGGKTVHDWLTVIREEPKKEESKGDFKAGLSAGLSLS